MDMAGKVVLLTGGTDGIGKAAALAFARRGATLVLLARDAAKAERVLAELERGSDNADLHAIPADLARLADVRHAAKGLRVAFRPARRAGEQRGRDVRGARAGAGTASSGPSC